jgi:hypothetical protein
MIRVNAEISGLMIAIRWSVRVMFFLLTFAGETERAQMETFLTL